MTNEQLEKRLIEMAKNVLCILKNWKVYKNWKARKNGKDVCDIKKGAGYYITTGLMGYSAKDKIHEWEMKSGKTMLVKLLEYRCFNDPNDMIEWSKWQYLGYKGEKKFSEMSFFDFLKQS